MSERDTDIREELASAVKYVCTVNDLDKQLTGGLKTKFQRMFPNPSTGDKRAWRMYYKGSTPQEFLLSRFGINYDVPTVRDAVAFDLVKLDDSDENSIGSVSNDTVYTYPEHINYSPAEYDRFLLNKNFRINLVNLEPEWTKKKFNKADGRTSVIRTVDRVYQGLRLSDTILGYFKTLFDNFNEDVNGIYLPFTDQNDISTEISLVPHNRRDFPAITTRAYYDMKYLKYLNALEQYGITAISSFALVDPAKDKNHTGEFLVKVQRKISDTDYRYVVARIDHNGKFARRPNGKLDIHFISSPANTILCVCKRDFCSLDANGDLPDGQLVADRRLLDVGPWTAVSSDIPMVKSTTSSHYSIFRQRIPEYDLKQVRHYLQFKNRLEGMEICLDWINRSIAMKEANASECFAMETLAIQKLFSELTNNKAVFELVAKYYENLAQYDKLYMKKTHLLSVSDQKVELLRQLQAEYASCPADNLDRKLSLGHQIQSLKLELNKGVKASIEAIDAQLEKIVQEIRELNQNIREIQRKQAALPDNATSILAKIQDNADAVIGKAKTDFEKLLNDEFGITGRSDEKQDAPKDEKPVEQDVDIVEMRSAMKSRDVSEVPELEELNFDDLHRKILLTERWNGFMLNLGYELNQLREMQTICSDATIKVRRLVHNFEEKMKNVEEDVWNDRHELREDFSFTGIAQASLKEIILLHDWYACNAPGKTSQEMGFDTDEDFLAFRQRCNKIAYNLRKNQYAQMLAMKKYRIQERIQELLEIVQGKDELKYHDKYGKDGITNEEKPWSIDDVTPEQEERIRLITRAEELVKTIKPSPPVIPSRVDDQFDAFRVADGIVSRMKFKPIIPDHKESNLEPFIYADDMVSRIRQKIILPQQSGINLFGDYLVADRLWAGWRPEVILPQSVATDFGAFVKGQKDYEKHMNAANQYKDDAKMMVERTIAYLKRLGLIQTEEDIEKLVVRNRALHYSGNVTSELNILDRAKNLLDKKSSTMMEQREALQGIIDRIDQAEKEIIRLKEENANIFNLCLTEKNRQARNRMLLKKLENENRILELTGIVKAAKKKNMSKFATLQRMRALVDKLQEEYDSKVAAFKDTVGLNQEAIDRLMVGIYNEFQDEILNGVK